MKKVQKKGYITVYLSLTTGILISFLFTLIEGTRMNTIQFQTECVTDIGLNSIFAEYHREMLNQYDLLFIDASYGTVSQGTDKTKSHLLQYMNLNFDPPGQDAIPMYRNLTSVRADNASLRDVSFASDQNGAVMEYQILKYMKDTSGISLMEGAKQSYQDYAERENQYDQYAGSRSQNKESINGIIDEINAQKEEDEDPVGISNPADSVEELSASSVLNYALKDVNTLSRNQVMLSQYISHRGFEDGFGLRSYQQSDKGILDRQLYYQYLFSKCGYYSKKKENAALNYQLEYILKGIDNDVSNLEKIAEQIFKIRYVINMTYLFSDSAKQAEAEELAIIVTSGIMHPELSEAVKLSILFAWGYAESAKDLRILFDGNKLTDTKTASTWNTPLSQMVTFKEHLGEYSLSGNGRTYKEYLYGFLMLKDKDTINKRLMDIMEMDIRRTDGNQNFKMDQCIYQLQAQINVSSKYGYGYQINRSYSYE